jgi:hypothetical protein
MDTLPKLDALLVSVEQIRPSGSEGIFPASRAPEHPGHCLVPLQGTKNLPFDPNLQRPFLTSRIAVLGYPRSELQVVALSFTNDEQRIIRRSVEPKV